MKTAPHALPIRVRSLIACLATFACSAAAAEQASSVQATRVGRAPIVTSAMLPGTDGVSVNGPSLIRVPAWVKNPLGKYYLYFGHHSGKYIRMAYADSLDGPWKLHEGGVQRLDAQTLLVGHIASPEAVIDESSHQIFLFYHGGNPNKGARNKEDSDGEAGQVTTFSISADGLDFTARNQEVGPAYLRVFHYAGQWFGLNHSGVLRRAAHLGEPFEPVATIIGPDITEAVDPARLGEPDAPRPEDRAKSGSFRYSIRHVGTDVHDGRLDIYFSCAGHRPERILRTVVSLDGPPETWRAHGVSEVLRPERDYEGADLPLAYSLGGSVHKYGRPRARELRDPAVYRDGNDAWLIYSVAGEFGLGLARLRE